MSSPVSPDADVPEHQPDQHGPFYLPQTGGLPQTGRTAPLPTADEAWPGRSPGRPGSNQAPLGQEKEQERESKHSRRAGSGTGGGGRGRRSWIWSVLAFVVAAGVIGAAAFHIFGPGSSEESTVTWAVDGCAGPDTAPEDAGSETADYHPLTCDDPDATVTVLDIQDAVQVGQVHCPAGTDVIFQKEGQAGGRTQAVCARNLSDDHPGDPGMGGGQLMVGDCVDDAGRELTCSSDGTREVVALLIGGDECPEGAADQIDLGFDAQRSYETICLGG